MPRCIFRARRPGRTIKSPIYTLDDEFAYPLANPLPNPLDASPGPGNWTPTDLDARLSIAGDKLLSAAAGGAPVWDRCMLIAQPSFVRQVGLYYEFEVTPTDNVHYLRVTWQTQNNPAIAYHEAGLYVAGGANVVPIDGLDPVQVQWPYVGGTSYVFRCYVTDIGYRMFAKKTSDQTWTILWDKRLTSGPLTQLYLAVNNHSLPGSVNWIRARYSVLPCDVVNVPVPPPGLYAAGLADALTDLDCVIGAETQRSLLIRRQDANNYWQLLLDNSASPASLQLNKVAAGVTTTVGTTTHFVTVGATYTLRAVCFGSQLFTFLGATPGPKTTDAFNQTQLGVGTGPTPGGIANQVYRHLFVRGGGVLRN